MAIVSLDDSDPVDAAALAYRDEMNLRRAEGAFWGSTTAEAIWQHGQITEKQVGMNRRQKTVATTRGK